MAITLTWAPQVGLDSIEIYRDTKRINEASPGQPLATLPADATQYVDDTVVENTNYFYTVVAVKAGNRTFSVSRCIPYLTKWGPEAPGAMSPRGEMDAAYLNYLPNTLMLAPAGLWAMVPETAGMTKGTWATWLKFIFNGKILFVPNIAANTGVVNASYNQLNLAGLLFGENDPAKLPSWAAPDVNHKKVITIGENEYIVRAMRISNEPFDVFVATQAQCANSEYHSTLGRFTKMSLVGAAAQPYARPRFLHQNGYGTIGPHLFDATKVASCLAAAPEVLNGTIAPTTTTAPVCLVLELVP